MKSNKGPPNVQKQKSIYEKMDRRVLRTRGQLGDALIELIHRKPFHAITVQDVLKSAKISRSTFYNHYRDKNDLFLSDAEDFFVQFASMLSRRDDTSDRIAPVRELFAHVAEWRSFCSALISANKLQDVLELAEGLFSRSIEERLKRLARANAIPNEQRAAVAKALAGALFGLLLSWLHRGCREPPDCMDELYHRLAWNGCAWRS